MNTVEECKMRMKRRRGLGENKKPSPESRTYVNMLITRVLVSVILFFGAIVLSNMTTWGREFIEKEVLTDSISFAGLAHFYDKYLGSIVPFDDILKDDATVFDEKLSYEEITNYKDGYELKVKKNYLVPVVNSGIVVFIGEKEGYGNTIIVQGIDEVDYWYSNVTNVPISLYDYVSKGNYLGTVDGDKLYMTFKKGSEYLEYDEVIK